MAKTPRLTSPIGVIASAMLTESQFQALNGDSWILADGRSVASSSYAVMTGQTSVPDLRGMVLRGKNNGRSDGKQNPDGELSLGQFQLDEFRSHTHEDRYQDNTGEYHEQAGGWLTHQVDQYRQSGAAGGNETRMKNVTVNFFIKINP